MQIQIADILDFEILLRKIEFRIDSGVDGGRILDFCIHGIPLFIGLIISIRFNIPHFIDRCAAFH